LNIGKVFEQEFKESTSENVYFLRLKDTYMQNNQFGKGASSNPCDNIMYKYPNMFLIELKSTKGTSFSFSEKIIKKNQILQLHKAKTYDGIVAGFIFNFRRYEKTYFVDINKFIEFKDTCGKKSINEKDCQSIGLLIEQELKRTKYKYNVEKFVNEVASM
jgi:recombination protein U